MTWEPVEAAWSSVVKVQVWLEAWRAAGKGLPAPPTLLEPVTVVNEPIA